MISNKKYFVSEINSSKAFRFTSLYHYSHIGYKSAILNLGIFRNSDNKLVGVLQWGNSFQEKIRLDRYVKEKISKENYFELNRFCMADGEEKNSESQAISLGIKWIKKYRPNIKLLVSYAGRKEGNYGYIYQATNWEYLGYFISHGFWIVDGQEKHLMGLWSTYNKSKTNLGFMDWLNEKYEDVRDTYTKQFIYIMRLDKNLTAASPILPYPKPATDYPIKTKEIIRKRNDEVYNNPSSMDVPFVEYYYNGNEKLFSNRALRKRGELPEVKPKIIVMYNENGEFEQSFYTTQELIDLGYTRPSLKKAIEKRTLYKNKFFTIVNNKEDIQEEIDIPFVCMIDEIPFYSCAAAAKYLGMSRQAVQQSKARHGKKLLGKQVIWGEL